MTWEKLCKVYDLFDTYQTFQNGWWLPNLQSHVNEPRLWTSQCLDVTQYQIKVKLFRADYGSDELNCHLPISSGYINLKQNFLNCPSQWSSDELHYKKMITHKYCLLLTFLIFLYVQLDDFLKFGIAVDFLFSLV